MTINRPTHLSKRFAEGMAFGERIAIESNHPDLASGGRADDGTWSRGGEGDEYYCCVHIAAGATAPPSPDSAEVRVLTEGGVRLESMRVFYLTDMENSESIPEFNTKPVVVPQSDVNPGTIIRYPITAAAITAARTHADGDAAIAALESNGAQRYRAHSISRFDENMLVVLGIRQDVADD